MPELPIPIEIHREDHQIVLTWADDHKTVLPARQLRLACQCAACRDEMTGAPLLDPVSVSEEIRPLSISLVGSYGFSVQWSDGHGTGIYTYESLYTPPSDG